MNESSSNWRESDPRLSLTASNDNDAKYTSGSTLVKHDKNGVRGFAFWIRATIVRQWRHHQYGVSQECVIQCSSSHKGGRDHSDHSYRVYRITKGNSCDRCDLEPPELHAHVDNLLIPLPIMENAKPLRTGLIHLQMLLQEIV